MLLLQSKNIITNNIPAFPVPMFVICIIPKKLHDLFRVNTSRRILPSLWIASVMSELENNQHVLLKFNEQYDKQWILIGAQVGEHFRCDGYANCYLIDGHSLDETALYIIYWPEILSLIGLLATIFTIGTILRNAPYIHSKTMSSSITGQTASSFVPKNYQL